MRQFLSFFGGSAVGLLIDLVGFQLLVSAGLAPWQANVISSMLALTTVYFLVARFAFAAAARLRTYLLFFVWYASNIVVFSSLIQLAVTLTDGPPFGFKLASIPVSFAANYLFTRVLFRRATPPAT
ncbi:GtrA family protein [Cryobacterium melibiosiphilum]|nr:GtrA family protein [Cryobacterium melibiosiphilum]